MDTQIISLAHEFIDFKGNKLSLNEIEAKTTKLAFCLTDEHGIFVEVNEAYQKLYGYREDELIGNHFTMVVPHEGRAYAQKMHEDFIQGIVETPADWIVQNKNGEQFEIYIESILVKNKNDEGRPKKLTLIETKNH